MKSPSSLGTRHVGYSTVFNTHFTYTEAARHAIDQEQDHTPSSSFPSKKSSTFMSHVGGMLHHSPGFHRRHGQQSLRSEESLETASLSRPATAGTTSSSPLATAGTTSSIPPVPKGIALPSPPGSSHVTQPSIETQPLVGIPNIVSNVRLI